MSLIDRLSSAALLATQCRWCKSVDCTPERSPHCYCLDCGAPLSPCRCRPDCTGGNCYRTCCGGTESP